MNYQLYAVNDLISETISYHLVLDKQINEKDLEFITLKMSEDKLSSIGLEINAYQTRDLLYKLIGNLSKDFELTKIRINIFEISVSEIKSILNIFAESYIFLSLKSNENFVETKLIKNGINSNIIQNNMNLINNLRLSYLNMDEDDIHDLLLMIEYFSVDIDRIQGDLNKYEQSYKNLEKRFNEGAFDSHNIKYNNLLEKYKDTLKRLENLRNSRLGKLQIKYWDFKG